MFEGALTRAVTTAPGQRATVSSYADSPPIAGAATRQQPIARPSVIGVQFYVVFTVFLLHSTMLVQLFPFQCPDAGKNVSDVLSTALSCDTVGIGPQDMRVKDTDIADLATARSGTHAPRAGTDHPPEAGVRTAR